MFLYETNCRVSIYELAFWKIEYMCFVREDALDVGLVDVLLCEQLVY